MSGHRFKIADENAVYLVILTAENLTINYRHDAAGNRVAKMVDKDGEVSTTNYYLRDASGNVMAIYQDSILQEQPIYGSSRLGMYTRGRSIGQRTLGTKRYELSNHLGNVLSTVSDNIG